MLFHDASDHAQLSPVSVFDFSALVNLDHDESLKMQAPPMFQAVPPPLESITTSCTEDDSDSLSSISTQDHNEDKKEEDFQEEEATPQKRSIFSHYWEKTGEHPFELQRRHSCPLPASNSAGQGAEQVKKIEEPREAAHDGGVSKSSERRSIFGIHHDLSSSIRSEPLLMFPMLRPMSRKARSASTLLDRPPSILRQKSCERQRRHSVSFDEKVDVLFFQPPQENWTCGGWAKLFAF
jgi:hypothetical protein